MFSHKKPEAVRLDQWNVAVHGQSYAHQHVTEDLSANYPAPVSGAFNIGMLHTCLEDGGTDYAPACLHKLVASGYDYWALGHIHDRQDLSQGRVHIECPGNIQGRSIRETGPKGCTLVSVADDHSVVTRFQALDVVRWQEVSIEADDHNLEIRLRNALQAALLCSEGRLLAVRLHVTGSVENGQALRDRVDAIAVELGEIWIEKILVKPRPESRDGTGLRTFQLGAEIRQALDELETDDVIVAEWMQGFHRLREHLTGELSETDPARIMRDPKAFRVLAAQVAKGLS